MNSTSIFQISNDSISTDRFSEHISTTHSRVHLYPRLLQAMWDITKYPIRSITSKCASSFSTPQFSAIQWWSTRSSLSDIMRCAVYSLPSRQRGDKMRWGNETSPLLWHCRRWYHLLLRASCSLCCRSWKSGSNVLHLHVWSIVRTLDDIRETDCHLVPLAIRINLSGFFSFRTSIP